MSNEPESLGHWRPGLSKLGSFSIEDIDTIYNIVNIIIGDPYLSFCIMICELYCIGFLIMKVVVSKCRSRSRTWWNMLGKCRAAGGLCDGVKRVGE